MAKHHRTLGKTLLCLLLPTGVVQAAPAVCLETWATAESKGYYEMHLRLHLTHTMIRDYEKIHVKGVLMIAIVLVYGSAMYLSSLNNVHRCGCSWPSV